jgi:hypothetical protein
VTLVTSGWKGFREINTATYDPGRITVKEMEDILIETGTYRGTVKNNR